MQDPASSYAKNMPAFRPDWAFFLDIDGTLLRLADHPDAVHVPQRVIDLLTRIERAVDGAIAVVSGRSLQAIDGLLSPLQLPAAGQHGAEWRTRHGTSGVHRDYHEALTQVRETLEKKVSRRPGLLLEYKGASLTLHYRGASHDRPLAEAWLRSAAGKLPMPFELHHGKDVIELRPADSNKGVAIETLMDEAPFRGRRPLFIGDDVTDEDGFRTVNALGGDSVKVGGGKTAARWRLPDSDAVLDWLEQLLTQRT